MAEQINAFYGSFSISVISSAVFELAAAVSAASCKNFDIF